ncbi:MAG: pyrroline-5-carboxylate reductase, partial [Nitrospirae bacterium CG_4_10_14_3_um_filter_53_41]
MKRPKIGLIGAGNMGGALLQGWISSSTARPQDILVSDADVEKARHVVRRFKVKAARHNQDLSARSDVILLAVKPQIIDQVLKEIAETIAPRTLLISIAAGVSLFRIEKGIGKKVRAARVMPNTPALIQEGISALSFNSHVTSQDKKLAVRLLNAVGETVVVDEKIMDAVTGLSGSGPAYVFVLIEALSDAGVRQGIPRDVATRLAVQTVRGASGMALKSGRHTGELKDMVTSPGGTTIAGLHALEKGKFRAALYNAVEAATQRSKEL